MPPLSTRTWSVIQGLFISFHKKSCQIDASASIAGRNSLRQIADEFQLLVAANKALHSKLSGSMITKGLHTELLFCLYGAKSIAEALSTFGISDER